MVADSKEYDLCRLLLNFEAERLEYKKKFRLPKHEQVLL